jgi:hypothetical protein
MLSSSGTYSGIFSQVLYRSLPPGRHTVFLYVGDYVGGRVLQRDFAVVEIVDLIYREGRGKPRRSATRARTALPPPTPAKTPLPTPVPFTASFAIRHMRVRKIFCQSFLLPIIAYR